MLTGFFKWAWRGRADDIIVFLNGEKTNPVSMEQHIVAQNRELASALVIGNQRFQPALLIEPATLLSAAAKPLTTSEQAELIENVWPSVQEANAVAPAHARVEKSLILVVDRPLIRAGKGTIQRAASVQQYIAQIETLYTNADVVVDDELSGIEPLDLENPDSVTRFVRQSVDAVTGWSSSDKGDDTGTFFERGMDSLMALQLIRALRRGLHRPDLGLSTVYSKPRVDQLSTALFHGREDTQTSDASLIDSFFATHRVLIEQIPKPKQLDFGTLSVKAQSDTVLLTGSTGSIGTYLLRALLDRPGISHVICLNRSEDGGQVIQTERMVARGLNVADLHERVTFLQTDLSKPRLGLDEATYEDLSAKIGLIIHNAWPVNFNLNLIAFKPQFLGLVNLFRLATETTSGAPARFAFISSVSAVVTGGKHPAPETVLALSDAPNTNGYAQSKFLSELLCEIAAHELDIPMTIARVGQVAGAVRLPGGEWNRKEWLPSLVTGSISMGCFPNSLGSQFSEIDWLPVDYLADILVDLVQDGSQTNAGSEAARKMHVFNLRNPQTTIWEKLLPSIIEAANASFVSERSLKVVSPSIWLERLDERTSEEDADGLENHAIKLSDFYRHHLFKFGDRSHKWPEASPPMSVEQASAHSATLRDMEAVAPHWVQKWVSEWLS